MEIIQEKVLALQKGDMDAYSWLYQETYNRNYYIVQRMVGNEQDTLDILQDAYVKVYQNIHSFHYTGPASFASWTGKIASNTALDFLRKKKMILFSDWNQEGEEDIELEFEDESIEGRPDLVLEQKETTKIVSELLGCLSEEQRVCVVMRYFQEMKISEIAAQCGCTENTVKSRLNYAKKHLSAQKEMLERKGIRLYNVAPFALLVFLLRQDASACTTPRADMISREKMAENSPMNNPATEFKRGGKKFVKTAVRTSNLVKIIVGVTVPALVMIGIVSYIFLGGMSKKGGHHASKSMSSETSLAAIVQEATQEPTPEPTPEVTPEPTMRPEEDIFYEYLNQTLIPKYKVAPLKQNGKMTQRDGEELDQAKNRWFKPKGIISCHISDLDSDHQKEMFVLTWTEKKKNEYGEYHYPMAAQVYEIEDGNVVTLADENILDDGYGWFASNDTCGNFSVVRMKNGTKVDFVFSECRWVEAFADGQYEGMYSMTYNGSRLKYVQQVMQTQGGSDDFVYSGYTYKNGKKKETVLYKQYDAASRYSSLEEAEKDFFAKKGLDVSEIVKNKADLKKIENTPDATLLCAINNELVDRRADDTAAQYTVQARFTNRVTGEKEWRKHIEKNKIKK